MKPSGGSSELEWCHDGKVVVPFLAKVYSEYSKVFKVNGPLQDVPDAVKQCRDVHMMKYFEWIRNIQHFINTWQQKIINEEWTESEIMQYANMTIPLHEIAMAVHTEELHVDTELVAYLKTNIQVLKASVKDTLIYSDSDGRR